MRHQLLVFVSSVATVLAKGACGTGIYNSPKTESFATVGIQVGLPVNTTTPDGVIGKFPIVAGNITGQFKGKLAPNLSSTTERVLNSPASSGEFSTVETEWVFETADKGRILVRMEGSTTYQNNALHGFGRATMQTTMKEFFWVNWAAFLIEWEGNFNTGLSQFEFFKLASGGRKDGKPIPALLPPGGVNKTSHES